MIAMAQTIVVQRAAPIHWEAVLVTAVPATLAMIGSIAAAWITRGSRRRLASIDNAVNGIKPGERTLNENVRAIAEMHGIDTEAPTDA